jgi:putative transposase
LTPERPSITALMRETKRRFFERRLPAPAYRTVRRRLESLDPKLVTSKREGSKKARERYGPVGVSCCGAVFSRVFITERDNDGRTHHIDQ